MPKVDNKIHFVWVGNTIPEEKVDLILKHLFTNYPDYEVFLWTDKAAENSDLFEAVVNGGGVRHLADKASRAEIAPAAWRNFGSHLAGLTFSRNSTVRGHLLFIDVSSIVAECPLRTRYHSAIDTRDYGRASDVLRIAILLQEGGIYMDTDVTCLKKLPVGISAPEGLLIGHGQSFYINALTNAVMAAPKRSETVSKLMGAIGGQFNRYDQKRWWDLVERAREDGRRSLTQAEASGGSDRMFGAISKHQEAMAAGTNVVTGPEAVVMFLYFLLIKPDQMQLDAITRERLLGVKEAATPSEYLRQVQLAQKSVFKPALEQSGAINRIAFPKGYLDIGSEASWINNAR